MGVHFTDVYLIGVYLMSVHLTGVHLMGVHLTGVHLTGVHISVYLMGVYLMGAYLMSVHLTGVHIMGVHLMGVYLMGVPHGRTSWAYLMGVYLTGVHLMSVHLMGVHLMGVLLTCLIGVNILQDIVSKYSILIFLRLLNVFLSAINFVGYFMCSLLVTIRFSSSQQLVRHNISQAHGGSGNGRALADRRGPQERWNSGEKIAARGLDWVFVLHRRGKGRGFEGDKEGTESGPREPKIVSLPVARSSFQCWVGKRIRDEGE